MSEPSKTALYDRHVGLGAKMVEFAGWMMPLNYGDGIVKEHLATRKYAGLFDVSHMGRFVFGGNDSLDFLQHVLTNNAAALDVGKAQYTIIPNKDGSAIDDAYLYHFFEDEYLLVVNAANRQKDWEHFKSVQVEFDEVEMIDKSEALVMLSLQGPVSEQILNAVIESGQLPEPKHNELSIVKIKASKVLLSRTGYTGEPIGFELFIPSENATSIWDTLIANGANPIGLGARDTLRLEAGLPLYGHELGLDPGGNEIPIFACPLAKFAVSFSPLKGDFIGKVALEKQHEAFKKIQFEDYSSIENLPRMIMPLAVLGKSVARTGAKVFVDDKHVGYVTSGTSVPSWCTSGQELDSKLTEETIMRPVCLGLIDSHLREDDKVQIEIRGKKADAVVVSGHLRLESSPRK